MLKMLVMLKRRAGMSREEFMAYYESTHAKLGEKYMHGNAVRYIRRYLTPVPNPASDETPEAEYDVVTEVWFKDVDQWHSMMRTLSDPKMVELITEDEKRLFDRTRIQAYTVAEVESKIS